MTCLTIFFGQVYLISNGATLLLFISLCLHHRAFYKMFQRIAIKLDRPNGDHNIREILCEIIQFHSSAKESVEHIALQSNIQINRFEENFTLLNIIDGSSNLPKCIVRLFSFNYSSA